MDQQCVRYYLLENPKYYTEDLIKNYDENDDYGAILEVDVEYPVMTRIKHRSLQFLLERRKINGVNKLVTILDEKEKYVIHILALKQALNHGLKLKKVHRVIEFKQEAWLEPYIMKNTNLRIKGKNEFEKDFFKLSVCQDYGKCKKPT